MCIVGSFLKPTFSLKFLYFFKECENNLPLMAHSYFLSKNFKTKYQTYMPTTPHNFIIFITLCYILFITWGTKYTFKASCVILKLFITINDIAFLALLPDKEGNKFWHLVHLVFGLNIHVVAESYLDINTSSSPLFVIFRNFFFFFFACKVGE